MESVLTSLIQWANGNPQGPVIASLKITSSCNLKCIFCCVDYSGKTNPRELKQEDLLRIINEGKTLGIKRWRIDGEGEIFMKPQITMAVLKRIKRCNMGASVVTNGTLLNDNLIKELVEIKLDRVSISINGSDAKTHDRLVGVKGAFDRVRSNIKKLNYWKKKKNSDYPALFFVPTLTTLNYKQLPKMMKLAAENDCTNFLLQSLRVYSKREKKLKLSKIQTLKLKKYVIKAKKIAEENNIAHNLDIFIKHNLSENSNNMNKVRFEETSKFKHNCGETITNPNKKIKQFTYLPCFNPFYTIIINSMGGVHPCYFLYNIEKNLKQSSLKSIWFSKEFTQIRKNLIKGLMVDECSKCCVPLFGETLIIQKNFLSILQKIKNQSI